MALVQDVTVQKANLMPNDLSFPSCVSDMYISRMRLAFCQFESQMFLTVCTLVGEYNSMKFNLPDPILALVLDLLVITYY